MTKIILHGGRIGSGSEAQRTRFFEEIVRDLPLPISVLLVYFARPMDEWDRLTTDDRNSFASVTLPDACRCIVASLDPDVFSSQVHTADVVYVRGGDTQKLMETMRSLKLSREMLEGKTYVGSSAGAYLVAQTYYSNDEKKVEHGFGFLPIKCFAHWDETQQDQLEALKKSDSDGLIVTLREGAFEVFTI